MKTSEQLTNLFRERGLRVTPQRQVIFRLLSAVEVGQMQPKQAVDVAAGELQAQLKDDLIVK